MALWCKNSVNVSTAGSALFMRDSQAFVCIVSYKHEEAVKQDYMTAGRAHGHLSRPQQWTCKVLPMETFVKVCARFLSPRGRS